MCRVSVPPRRSNVRSSSTRRSLACIAGESAATSSRTMRAALRHFEAARLARDGARERAALVAEKFGFDEFRGQAGAINFQERRFAPRTALMNPARELVLARAAFAGDEQGGGRGRRAFRPSPERRARPDRPPPIRCLPQSWLCRAAFGFLARLRRSFRARGNRSARPSATAARDRNIPARAR